MPRAYGSDLRVRGGLSTRQAAARFAIGIATAGAWHLHWGETGEAKPGRLGNPGGSKLDAHEAFILGLIAAQKDIALHEIAEEDGPAVQPPAGWYFLNRRRSPAACDETHCFRGSTRRARGLAHA
jgi:transposase